MISVPHFAPYTPEHPHTASVLYELAQQSSYMSVQQRVCACIISHCAVAVVSLLIIGFHSHCCVAFTVLALNLIILCSLLFFLYANRLVEHKKD